MTSSDNEDTNGISIKPITTPAASALCAAISRPMSAPKSRMAGATVKAAKKPNTTVGMPARISRIGLPHARTTLGAYSVI